MLAKLKLQDMMAACIGTNLNSASIIENKLSFIKEILQMPGTLNRGYYMPTQKYEISLRVLKNIANE